MRAYMPAGGLPSAAGYLREMGGGAGPAIVQEDSKPTTTPLFAQEWTLTIRMGLKLSVVIVISVNMQIRSIRLGGIL